MSTAVIDPDVELRFPLGRFQPPLVISPAQRSLWIAEIAALPANLQQAIAGLSDSQLDTPYRPGGWTIRQVTHHLADSQQLLPFPSRPDRAGTHDQALRGSRVGRIA